MYVWGSSSGSGFRTGLRLPAVSFRRISWRRRISSTSLPAALAASCSSGSSSSPSHSMRRWLGSSGMCFSLILPHIFRLSQATWPSRLVMRSSSSLMVLSFCAMALAWAAS